MVYYFHTNIFRILSGVHGNGQQDENAYETCRRSNRKKCITIEKRMKTLM